MEVRSTPFFDTLFRVTQTSKKPSIMRDTASPTLPSDRHHSPRIATNDVAKPIASAEKFAVTSTAGLENAGRSNQRLRQGTESPGLYALVACNKEGTLPTWDLFFRAAENMVLYLAKSKELGREGYATSAKVIGRKNPTSWRRKSTSRKVHHSDGKPSSQRGSWMIEDTGLWRILERPIQLQ